MTIFIKIILILGVGLAIGFGVAYVVETMRFLVNDVLYTCDQLGGNAYSECANGAMIELIDSNEKNRTFAMACGVFAAILTWLLGWRFFLRPRRSDSGAA